MWGSKVKDIDINFNGEFKVDTITDAIREVTPYIENFFKAKIIITAMICFTVIISILIIFLTIKKWVD